MHTHFWKREVRLRARIPPTQAPPQTKAARCSKTAYARCTGPSRKGKTSSECKQKRSNHTQTLHTSHASHNRMLDVMSTQDKGSPKVCKARYRSLMCLAVSWIITCPMAVSLSRATQSALGLDRPPCRHASKALVRASSAEAMRTATGAGPTLCTMTRSVTNSPRG